MNPPPSITLSLISHTNMGKTTLARTLLRRDVGHVLDQAHVTLQKEQFILLETPEGRRLNLWDTPGFGNSHKLLTRLQGLTNPIGWLTSHVWDRLADKPFWCSQQAILNVRDEADIVLYLVNATEDPSMAGYLQPELDILSWLKKPVIMLLNQTGLREADELRNLEKAWKIHWQSCSILSDITTLDAFSRCWVQEGLLWEKIAQALPPEKQSLMKELATSWATTNQHVFDSSMDCLAHLLVQTATDGETLNMEQRSLSKKSQVTRALNSLDHRLGERISTMSAQLITLHELTGDVAHTIQSRIEDISIPGEKKAWEEESFWGALVSGAAAGFASDIATGGLSHGVFTIGGAIMAAIGERAYAKSQEQDDPNRISWIPAFLNRQTRDALLRYLAVTHCGRGRGDYTDPREFPQFWQQATERILEKRTDDLKRIWKLAQAENKPSGKNGAHTQLISVLSEMTTEILLAFYPEAKTWLVQ